MKRLYENGTLRFVATMMAVGLLLMLSPNPASANTTYTYTGNPFTTFSDGSTPGAFDNSDFISGSFTLSFLLPQSSTAFLNLNSYSFTNGRCTLTNQNSTGGILFTVGAPGQMSNWRLDILRETPDDFCSIHSQKWSFEPPDNDNGFYYAPNQSPYSADSGSNAGTPGTWSVTTTPEPSSLSLFAVAIASIGLGYRKTRS